MCRFALSGLPADIIRKSFTGVGSYLFGVAVAWISVYVAFGAYFITPRFFHYASYNNQSFAKRRELNRSTILGPLTPTCGIG